MLLRDKDRRALCEIFKTSPVPIEVWAYGSRVNGTAHDTSDLDLAIRTFDLTPLPLAVFTDLKAQIRESNIPILVDLFDWTKLPESFQHSMRCFLLPMFDLF
ncbi:nucleotidyltransferase family protein [Rhodoflexus sp.]